MKWFDKNYHSLNYFFKNKFNYKVIKIPLNVGFTCPNRDGKLSTEGCIFCSESGSGEFSGNPKQSIAEQFISVREKLTNKWAEAKYIPYFQAYTNTYANIRVLREKYYEALSLPNVVGISIATRPDCLSDEILQLLDEINKKYFVMIELGLQTSNEKTANIINRCYDNNVFENAVLNLRSINIHTVAHVILGLPNESKQDMFNTVEFCSKNNLDGIKLQLLYILRGTRLEKIYKSGLLKPLTYEEYIDIVVSCLEILPKSVVIHRITGDGSKEQLVEPKFLLDKRRVLNGIDLELKRRNTYQGIYYNE